MGGFQAFSSAIGETGENLGVGMQGALNEALKVRQQMHDESMDKAKLALAQAGQQQEWNLAQQAHELTRSQIIQSGWKDMGATVNKDGTFSRNFFNDQLPEGQNRKVVPLSGIPPDSPQGLLQHYQTIRGLTDEKGNRLFDDMQSKQVAFRMPSLYKEGPAGLLDSFRDSAEEQFEKGVKAIKIPGLGTYPIDTPAGRANYAQGVLSTIHPGGLYRAMNPGAFGKQTDQSGWTAGEKREYDGLKDQVNKMEQLVVSSANTRMMATLDPNEQAKIQQDMISTITPMYKQLEDKQNEISARHNRAVGDTVQVISPTGVPGTIPRANLPTALSKGYKQAPIR